MKTRVYGKERQARMTIIENDRPGPGSKMSLKEYQDLKFLACMHELQQRGMTKKEIYKAIYSTIDS